MNLFIDGYPHKQTSAEVEPLSKRDFPSLFIAIGKFLGDTPSLNRNFPNMRRGYCSSTFCNTKIDPQKVSEFGSPFSSPREVNVRKNDLLET